MTKASGSKPPYQRGVRTQNYISSSELAFIEQRQAVIAECMMLGCHSATQVFIRMQAIQAERKAKPGSISGSGKTKGGATGSFDVSLRTIRRDMSVIRERWGSAAADTIEHARAVQLAQHQDIINALWPKRKEPRSSEVILKALAQVAMLTGANKPIQHEITMPPELVAMLNARGVKIKDVFNAMMDTMLADGSAPVLGVGSGMPDPKITYTTVIEIFPEGAPDD